jgi:hypothetical protein
MVGTALVMAAMFFTSLYATFVDCFGPPPEAEGTEPAKTDKLLNR